MQLLRAVFAAIAAAMVTFTADHSAQLGLAAFSGFAIATALVLFLASWLTYPSGSRAPVVWQAIVMLIAGMAGGVGGLRTPELFFSVIISWALITGFIEAIVAFKTPRPRTPDARDALTVGVFTMLFGLALIGAIFLEPQVYSTAGQDFVLTNIGVGVGLFGAYAAILAVFLAIAGFSPRTPTLLSSDVDASPDASANDTARAAGAAPTSNSTRDNA